jgi:hypothetical protein
MRHIHADKIHKWAEDTSLIVERRRYDSESWIRVSDPTWDEKYQYRIVDPYADLKNALKDGKTIQMQMIEGYDEWRDMTLPILWNFPVDRCRIKPELIAYSFKDAAFLIGKPVKYKHSESLQLITRVLPTGVSIGNGVMSYGVLLSNYVFIDGEPCGYLEKS